MKMSLAFAGPATSFATTILSYFSPAKSPFYSVIAFGTVALILTCEKIETVSWIWVSVPIFSVLALSAVLSFANRSNFEEGQGEEQLRFARSFSISSALLTFVITARATEQVELAFWVNYDACLAQIVVFLLYTWARSDTFEEQHELNFVQFALITATFLIGASYASAEYSAGLISKPMNPAANRYLIVAAGLYLLWFSLLIFWIKHLRTLIRVSIPRSAPSPHRPNSSG
jgi:hypothetical protein